MCVVHVWLLPVAHELFGCISALCRTYSLLHNTVRVHNAVNRSLFFVVLYVCDELMLFTSAVVTGACDCWCVHHVCVRWGYVHMRIVIQLAFTLYVPMSFDIFHASGPL